MSIELSTATIDDISKELESRYESYILVVEGETKNDPSSATTHFAYSGGLSSALGLCSRFRRLLFSYIKDVIN